MSWVTPSKLASLEDCERLFHIQTLYPYHSITSKALVLGSATHENYRIFSELCKDSWSSLSIDEIQDQINHDAAKAVATTHELLVVVHPEFELDYRRSAAIEQLALRQWGNQRLIDVKNFIKLGYTFEASVNAALPLTEVRLASKELGIYGKADQVFCNGKLKITDLKTDERVTSFLHEEGHKLQLYAYAVMAEETFGQICKSVSILYTKSMTEITFPFGAKARQLVEDRLDDAKQILSSEHLPPMLTGLEAEAKCPRCYMRDICFQLANRDGLLHD